MAGTAATEIADGMARGLAQYPRLLYMCDLPPSNLNGGPILMRRLLADYPADRLTVACAPDFMRRAAGTLLDCQHVTLFRTSGTGRWGLGRVKQLVDLLAVPHIQRAAETIIREKRIEAVLTVAQDLFFLAAVGAARNVGVPCVAVVHDDWVSCIGRHMFVPRAAAPRLFRRTLQRASRVYAVSAGVQDWLAQDFGVASQVQLPATEAHDEVSTRARSENPFRIAYTGSLTAGPMVTMGLLVNVLLHDFAGHSWQLNLYGAFEQTARDRGWADPRIRAHGWSTQEQVRAALRDSDLVYLPMGFDPESRLFSVRSFPSKFADYLASGRPALVCAPPEASVSRYIREHACAELVEEPSPQRLADALRTLMYNPERRQSLASRGLEKFRAYHDIRVQQQEFVADLQRLIPARPECP